VDAAPAMSPVDVPRPARAVVRVSLARPACGELVRFPRSGVRVRALADGTLAVTAPGRSAVRIRAGARRVVVLADAVRDRLLIAWGTSRRVVRVRLLPERRVLVRGRGVTVPAPPGPAPAPPSEDGSPVVAPPLPSPIPSRPPAPGVRPPILFAGDAVWNRRVDDVPLAADSAEVAADLRRQALATGTWMNTGRWSVPVYVVGPDQPLVTVRDSDDGELNLPGPWRWGGVPLPPDAVAAGPHPDGDNHLVVWQPSTDTMWEFWRFRRTASGPEAPHGARIDRVSRGDGAIPAPYGAAASGIALAAGLITARDLARGSIDHALALGVPEIRAGVFVPPATRTDGYVDRATAPPMGARFRLDPAVDVDALGLPPLTRMVALAAQRHGLIVRDTSGAVTFYGEDPVSIGRDPFNDALAGGEMGEVMRTFPWQHIQMVAPEG